MSNIEKRNHEKLINILNELIETIRLMREKEDDYLLIQNEREAKEWIVFLKSHVDKEELKSLENEIADRLVFKFDVQIGQSELDKKRTGLMKKYLLQSYVYLK